MGRVYYSKDGGLRPVALKRIKGRKMTHWQQQRRVHYIGDLLSKVQYRWDWNWSINPLGDVVAIHIFFLADGEYQRCRRWIIENDASESDIYRTAFAAILAAEEHEARERFKVNGVPVFGPHGEVV